MIFFTYNIEPVAWQRVQRNRFGSTFVPAKTKNFKSTVQKMTEIQIKENYSHHDFFRYHKKDAMSIEISFVFTRPKKPVNPYPRQDIDNCAKGVLDALNGVVFEDDKQVMELNLTKRYTVDGESAHIAVSAKPVTATQ